MKKTIGLGLLLLLIGIICFGCAASQPADPLPEQPVISEGEGVGAEGQGGEQNENSNPLDPDSPVHSEGDSKGDLEGDSENGQGEGAGQSTSNADSSTSGGGNGGGSQSSEGSQGAGGGSLKCTFSINCSTVFDNLDKIDAGIVEQLPQDGWIYTAKQVEFTEGESVFDILQRVTRQEKIHMEFNSNPALKSKYVEGIHNLYEFDAGELSGWTYKINGKGMGYGSSSSYPKDGDVIEWLYTCDQGRDVGVEP